MTPEIKQAERDRLAADMARFAGTITVVQPGVSGDTYIERMNAHGKTAAEWDRKRLRGAKVSNEVQGKTGKKAKRGA